MHVLTVQRFFLGRQNCAFKLTPPFPFRLLNCQAGYPISINKGGGRTLIYKLLGKILTI